MIKINLIPSEILLRQKQQYRMVQGAALGGLVVLLVMGVSFLHYHKASKLESRLKAGEAELVRLQEIVAKVQALEAQGASVRARLNVIIDLLKGRLLSTYFLQGILKSLPNGIWLMNLTSNAVSPSSSKIQFNAVARSSEDLADWIRTLENSGEFSEVELGPVTVSESVTGKVLNFTISSIYQMKQ
ncbi:MAG: PilN domain-containing protein [Elusimicrobia bacterium]|nr:PilN domain-containing protein [Elusimicrobiota bacterium]